MKSFKLWVGIAMVAALVLGLTLGSVFAGGGTPGSSQDPLVTESYIEQLVDEKTVALEYKVVELENEVSRLTTTIATLEGMLGNSSSTTPAPAPQPKPEEPSQNDGSDNGTVSATKEVTTDGLRVRSGPGTSYDVITSVNKGDKVSVVAEMDGWYEIKLDGGKTGWISGSFVK